MDVLIYYYGDLVKKLGAAVYVPMIGDKITVDHKGVKDAVVAKRLFSYSENGLDSITITARDAKDIKKEG